MRSCFEFVFAGLAVLAPPAGGQPAAPRLTPDDLRVLAGTWNGTLEYLDYSDNRTRRTIGASLDWKATGDAIEYRFSYVEPDGKAVAGDLVKLTLHDDGAEVRLNDERWRVAGKTTDAKAGKHEFVLTRAGKDNDQPAELRRVLTATRETLTIRTEAKAAKAVAAVVRNEYVLKKQ